MEAGMVLQVSQGKSHHHPLLLPIKSWSLKSRRKWRHIKAPQINLATKSPAHQSHHRNLKSRSNHLWHRSPSCLPNLRSFLPNPPSMGDHMPTAMGMPLDVCLLNSWKWSRTPWSSSLSHLGQVDSHSRHP